MDESIKLVMLESKDVPSKLHEMGRGIAACFVGPLPNAMFKDLCIEALKRER